MEKKKIAVIFGGCSPEHTVSLASAAAVIRNIDAEKYEVIQLGITEGGEWFRFYGSPDDIEANTWRADRTKCIPAVISPDRDQHGILEFRMSGVRTMRLDAAFPVLHGRNGEDGRLAKNLARWLEGDNGMPVWSDDPIPPDALGCDGEPLDMEGLAKADPGFARLWRRVASRRNVILSLLYDRKPGASREEFEAECEADEALARHMAACEERYGRYLALCDSMEGGTAAGRRVAS